MKTTAVVLLYLLILFVTSLFVLVMNKTRSSKDHFITGIIGNAAFTITNTGIGRICGFYTAITVYTGALMTYGLLKMFHITSQ